MPRSTPQRPGSSIVAAHVRETSFGTRAEYPRLNAEIVHSFRIELPENQSKGPESPERDIALFAGARAFVFEVKSSIPTITHRRRAEVDDLPFHPRKSGSPGCVAENFVAFAGDA